jgi:hypothetical protein
MRFEPEVEQEDDGDVRGDSVSFISAVIPGEKNRGKCIDPALPCVFQRLDREWRDHDNDSIGPAVDINFLSIK